MGRLITVLISVSFPKTKYLKYIRKTKKKWNHNLCNDTNTNMKSLEMIHRGLPRKNGSIFLILIRWDASLYPHKLPYASRKSRAPILKAVVRRQWCLNDLRAIQPLVNLAFITHTWPQAGRSGIVVPGGWTRTITWEDGCTQTCFTFHVREQSTHDSYMIDTWH